MAKRVSGSAAEMLGFIKPQLVNLKARAPRRPVAP
jgi:hypothetical protein